jgi:hypothetical protein
MRDVLAPYHEDADDSITKTVSLREVSNPICHFLCCGWWPRPYSTVINDFQYSGGRPPA